MKQFSRTMVLGFGSGRLLVMVLGACVLLGLGLWVLRPEVSRVPESGSAEPIIIETTNAVDANPSGLAEVVPVEPDNTSLQASRNPESPAILAIEPASQFDPGSWPELPPEDAKLVDIFDDLRERADRGDHKAACRLALSLSACVAAFDRLHLQERMARVRSNMAPEYLADVTRELESALKRTEGCAGHQVQEDHLWRYTRQAANAGSVAAMERYAFDGNMLFASELSSAELKKLLGERDIMLLTAARAGSEVAAHALINRFTPLASGMALDPEAGLTGIEREQIVETLRRSTRTTARHMEIKGLDWLDATELAQVEAFHRHFAASQPPPSAPSRAVSGENVNERCERGYMPAPDTGKPIDWRLEFGMKP